MTNILGEEEGNFWGKLGNFSRVVGNRWSSGNGKAKDDDTRIATRFILISISRLFYFVSSQLDLSPRRMVGVNWRRDWESLGGIVGEPPLSTR